MPSVIRPDWAAPANVRAFTTTRTGGFSHGAWASLNLGDHCGDDPGHVSGNRRKLRALLPAEPYWLQQVHGRKVVRLGARAVTGVRADAAWTSAAGRVCCVLSADCLPVLFCDRAGTRVAAAHAGWRGLAAGVLEATVQAMDCNPAELLAWMGPAIGPQAYEVGQDVHDAFTAQAKTHERAFKRHGERWLADLYQLAAAVLAGAGVGWVGGGHHCTFTEKPRFFSFRRDGVTGRMASVIWLLD